MESLIKDIRFGVKLLWKDKGFAVTAILTLALCIGANTAIFSVINSVLLRPLPFDEAERIVYMMNLYPGAGVDRGGAGVPDYYDRRELTDAFEEVALYRNTGLTIGEQGTPERIAALDVTPSFFRLLRVEPHVGRIFAEDEGELGSEQKAILSHAAWHQYYGGDPSVLGSDIRLNGVVHQIVGMMPEDFHFLRRETRVFRPLAFTEEQKQQVHSNPYQMIARLKPGVTHEQAQQQIDALNAANMERLADLKEALINAGFHTAVLSFQDDLVREVRPTLYLLWGGVLFVLLIGCVNIANLVMVRSSVRMRELATRFSLGAGRWRVTRQLLTESVVLTVLGAAVGLILGSWGLGFLESLGIDRIPRGGEITMDATVVATTVGMALIVGVLIAIIPVVGILRVNMSSVFREEGRTSTSGRGTRLLRGLMVTSQVAIALVLLISAGLMLASFREVLALDPGYDPEGVLTGKVSLPGSRYPDGASRRAFMSRALEEIRGTPGVVEAGATTSIPLGGGDNDSVILAEGYVMEPGESLISPGQIRVTAGHFESMGIRLIAGRTFDDTDVVDSLPTIMVDRQLAEKFWSDADPIGKRMYFPTSMEEITAVTEDSVLMSVVGVVDNVRQRGAVESEFDKIGTYYLPYEQNTSSTMTFSVKAAGDPAALTGVVRATLSGIDPELPFYDVQTQRQRLENAMTTRRTSLMMALGFAVVALLLSAVGIYGVLAYLVTTRTKEIGVRLALGSSTPEVFRLVLREGLTIVASGIGLGLAGAFAMRTTIESQLYGVRPLDPVVWFSVAVVLAVVALVACVIPARRATRVDPVVAMGI